MERTENHIKLPKRNAIWKNVKTVVEFESICFQLSARWWWSKGFEAELSRNSGKSRLGLRGKEKLLNIFFDTQKYNRAVQIVASTGTGGGWLCKALVYNPRCTNIITWPTKIKLYKPVMMYSRGTVKKNKSDENNRYAFQNRCLRRIFKIRCRTESPTKKWWKWLRWKPSVRMSEGEDGNSSDSLLRKY